MNVRNVIWPEPILIKLRSFRSKHFTAEESHDYIAQIILETEDLLLNPVMGKAYTEEFGKYKDFTRVVIKKFRVYYELMDKNILIVAVLFPGEL